MKNQKDLIENVDWDYLIILDACRYDYFKRLYGDYLEGELRKVKSEGTYTGEWLAKNFEDYYPNITYVSSSPCVNGEGMPLSVTNPEWNIEWKATDHFSKIIDVWDFAWSKESETVPPTGVTETVLQLKDRNKKIIHYMQPHGPYLTLESDSRLDDGLSIFRERAKKGENAVIEYLMKIGFKFLSIIGKEKLWRIKSKINIPVSEPMEAAWRLGKVGDFYLDNLKKVLEEVSRLKDELNGKTIVTSDHGECLGKNNYWGHGPHIDDGLEVENKKRVPQLVEVPWLKVN